ncbi:BTB/POZ and TAZ domain-containing protein 4 [Cryptomeria japonica]|uniref:BTB/POZ and TAZ domain-containing protein 4 n=1 Tax=Cryptomeria japonica TaxID=3369 RepID=UPI0027DA007C|nr:BTB/POZ and TAZ domain-containing protein 4 [Cryptomeria japonica]
MAQAAVAEIDTSWISSSPPSYDRSMQLLQENCAPVSCSTKIEVSINPSLSRSVSRKDFPIPPPLPDDSYYRRYHLQKVFSVTRSCGSHAGYSCVPKETVNTWDNLFEGGYLADVCIFTEDGGVIPAHSNVLSIASPVLKNLLKQQKGKSRHHSFSITGVPYDAARVFIRFLYSSRYEQEDMQKFALHLLVLSHVFLVPSLKLVCTQNLEHGLLTTDNVIDMIQLARLCDASRLNLLCMRLILKNFKAVSKSEGWKVMRQSNPKLEQELLESVVEADSQKQERLHKIEEKRIYLQLYDAMEALVHICRDGCRTIGPHDKDLDDTMGPCNFPACKGLESLVRHFAGCKTRVPGGCVHCKRMWQLLELHSRMCYEPDVCKVPLCRHFKEKVQQQSKKDEVKWKVLVSKVQAAKRAVNAFSSAAVV